MLGVPDSIQSVDHSRYMCVHGMCWLFAKSVGCLSNAPLPWQQLTIAHTKQQAGLMLLPSTSEHTHTHTVDTSERYT